MPALLRKSQVTKIVHLGTRVARRIYPGMVVNVAVMNHPEKTYEIKARVRATHMYEDNNMVIETEGGFRIKCNWNDRFDVYGPEGSE